MKKVLVLFFFFVCNQFLRIQCINSLRIDGIKNKKNADGVSRNVTRVLNTLLRGYDKRVRPNYSGPPVVVGITININNINSVSEVNMDYSLDIFFRQKWVDKRLQFDLSADGINELVIGSDMLHKIWLPDTFIANDKKTYFHKATVQNKFIRISPDGQVLYSMRMTVTAACPMNFRFFPMDHQVCDLEIESYGFRMDDIKYKWGFGLKNLSALHISPDIELPQLKYKDSRLIEREFRLSTGVYSRLTMKLYFVRSLGYYIIQIYIPSTLIVTLSWVSFWLDISAAPARITLGMTTVLTMVTFIWSTNASLPKISYIKGIDVYLVTCFVMTFCSVIEYAIVSFIWNRLEKKKKAAVAAADDDSVQSSPNQRIYFMKKNGNNSTNNNTSKLVNNPENIQYRNEYSQSNLKKEDNIVNKSLPILIEKKCRCSDNKPYAENNIYSNNSLKRSNSIQNRTQNMTEQQDYFLKCQCQSEVYFPSSAINANRQLSYRISSLPHTNDEKGFTTSIFERLQFCSIEATSIDKFARAAFPIVFTTFHVVYWTVYLTISSSLWIVT